MANILFPTAQSQKTAPLWMSDHALADEGSYFIATNPTPGTAIATTTSVVDDAATGSSTHAQFAPVALFQNGYASTDPNAKTSYLKYLRMMLVQVPTSATTWRFALRTDSIARYASAGSTITPVNINSGSSNTSPSKLYFGAIVPVALPSSQSRLIANGTVGSVIPVTLDVWTFTFGDVVQPTNFLNGSASAKNVTISLGPVVVGPGCNVALEMWGASNAGAPSWEFEFGFAERPAGL